MAAVAVIPVTGSGVGVVDAVLVTALLLAVRIEGWANLERTRTMGPWTVRS
ncbi:MAG TPA: hypothetical protein VFQ17_04180 [Nocardioides sp.]|jgi:hypothetical protein|nr:hypothetical protein [Nocardioides sp.]